MYTDRQLNSQKYLYRPKQPHTPKSNHPQPPLPVPFYSLFRLADPIDKLLILIGSLAALLNGVALPAFSILWGNMIDAFTNVNTNPDKTVQAAKQIMYNFLEIGAGVFVASWLMFACWVVAGQRQSIKCRKLYLDALLKQQIGWYDQENQNEIASRFATETTAFHGAIGEKVPIFLMTISMTLTGFIIAYSKGWRLALVVTACIPVIGLAGLVYIITVQSKDKKVAQAYVEAGGKAQQAISAIKTVKSLNGEEYQIKQFSTILESALKNTAKYNLLSGLGIGSIFFALLACFSLSFWYGTQLVHQHVINNGKPYTAGDVMVIFISLLVGGFNLSQVTPCLKKFAEGKQAAARIFALLKRVPEVRDRPTARTISNIVGVIQFHNVTFAYPKQPEKMVLKNLNLVLKPNQTNALVGESGCGKSTIMQLIMRFYDPQDGVITLDGVDIRKLDIGWLRENIGYVGQEPVLFATSIRENLLLGKTNASNEKVMNALKKAEAWDFVSERGLESFVGYGGGQLSGGQKQRLAIARAILKDPKILLLDQATSALDRKNEVLIQKTLDSISKGRTTITIAHRVKTIMSAQQILVLNKGVMSESGRFDQLQRFRGYQQSKEAFKQDQEVQTESTKLNKDENSDTTKPEATKSGEQSRKLTKTGKTNSMVKLKKERGFCETYARVFQYVQPDICLFFLGILFAIANGTIFPIFSLFFGKMVSVLLQVQSGLDRISNANFQSLIFLILAISSLITNWIQISIFSIIGDRVTKRLRIDCFSKIIKMPIPWFDIPSNNAGTLTARLATDCQEVNSLITSFIGVSLQSISCMVAGMIISFSYQWRISMVSVCIMPLMIGSGLLMMKFMVGFSQDSKQAYKDSSNLIMEAMINIRTVMSFGFQTCIAEKYATKLTKPYAQAKRKGNISGILYGVCQIVLFTAFALLFFIGTLFIRDHGIKYENMFTAIYAIMFPAMTIGNCTQFMPDIAASKNSAASIFDILDGEDEDQLQDKQGSPKIAERIEGGSIVFDNVSFNYPGSNKNILTNLTLSIHPGHKVALVGASGCGKSTIIQMLLRFYDPTSGNVLLDGRNIKDYDIHFLRGLFGVVSQEPVLFNTSFKNNIKYNQDDATFDDVYFAAKKTNSLNFIEGLEGEDGYVDPWSVVTSKVPNYRVRFERGVGMKGSHLSGGQKQRIAIARAILRNPEMLLLDEATSALDHNNETKVQGILDQLMEGRTTISVAHRLETIKNSDRIYVLQKGRIVESGRYEELMGQKQVLFRLQRGSR